VNGQRGLVDYQILEAAGDKGYAWRVAGQALVGVAAKK